nr:MAG TPA: hypothetical protein [Caudoviricetes sp.]
MPKLHHRNHQRNAALTVKKCMPKVCFNGNDGNYLPHRRKRM